MNKDSEDNTLEKNLSIITEKIRKNVNSTLESTKFVDIIEIKNLQKLNNILFLNASLDKKNFKKKFEDKMSKILQIIYNNKKNNCNIKCLFMRSDYLFSINKKWKLVENNLISCAYPILGPIINKFHNSKNPKTVISNSDIKLLNFICEIKKFYENERISILIDDKNDEFTDNFLEKKILIEKLSDRKIEMIHTTMEEIRIYGEYKENILYLKKKPVFLIYYRYYYNHDHYKEKDIETRIKLESTDAVSIPTVEFQILGLKYFQKIWATSKNELEKYLVEKNKLENTFVKYKDCKDYKKEDLDIYILKTVNEGGNSNFFREDIEKKIKHNSEYFLMEKIIPSLFENCSLKSKVIPEIGIFGGIIFSNGKIVYNEEMGFICRTKLENVDECGVTKKNGYLDSIYFDD